MKKTTSNRKNCFNSNVELEEKNRKKEYAKSFKRMRNDSEQKFLSEAGLSEFVKMIKEYENS